MEPRDANTNIPFRFGIKSVFFATTIIGIVLHLAITVATQSFAMLGVNLLFFYIGAGIALSITSLAIMTMGSRASIVGALAGAAAWATLLWIVHNFEPSIQPYIPRHVVIFLFIAGWLVVVSAKTTCNGHD